MRSHNKKKLVFLAVGGFNTLADFICYSILMYLTPDSVIKLTLVGIISGILALCIAFFTHSRITWSERARSHGVLVRFFVTTGLGIWFLRPLLLNVFIGWVGIAAFVYSILHPYFSFLSFQFVLNTVAFLLMTVVMLVYNFFVYDKFVFNKKETNTE